MIHSFCQQIWKTQQWPQDWKKSVFIPIPKKGNAKECSNYCTMALISHANKIMLKILKARFYCMWIKNLQMYQSGLKRAEELEITLPTSAGLQKKQGNSRIISTFASLTTLKPLTMWVTTNWHILKEMEIPDHITYLWVTCLQQLELDMEQWTGSKLGKEYLKAVYYHFAYLTYVQYTSWEMLGWMKHKLESRLLGEISITSDMQVILLSFFLFFFFDGAKVFYWIL